MCISLRDLSDEAFYDDEVIADSIPPGNLTVGYFTAPWCGPCRMLRPVLEQLEAENEGLTVTRIDVDSFPEIAKEFQIMSVPTLFFYSDAYRVAEVIGIKPKKFLQEIIDKFL